MDRQRRCQQSLEENVTFWSSFWSLFVANAMLTDPCSAVLGLPAALVCDGYLGFGGCVCYSLYGCVLESTNE